MRNTNEARTRTAAPVSTTGRVPPHDLDAEAAVLSAVLLDTSALDRVLELLRPEHFYSEAHRRIFEACVELHAVGRPVDVVPVGTWLKYCDRIQEVVGVGYLTEVIGAGMVPAHVADYGRTIREKARVRQLIATCQRVAAEGYTDYGEAQTFIDGAEQSVYEIARTPESSSVEPVGSVIKTAFRRIVEASNRGERVTGIPTGFSPLRQAHRGPARGRPLHRGRPAGHGERRASSSTSRSTSPAPGRTAGSSRRARRGQSRGTAARSSRSRCHASSSPTG